MVRPRQDHLNILKIYEVIKDKEYYHVVTELLRAGNSLTGFRIESGTLRSLLHAANPVPSAQKRIIHRDLKPETLIFENDSENSLLKVIDFGTSCTYDENPTEVVGIAYYIARKSSSLDIMMRYVTCGAAG